MLTVYLSRLPPLPPPTPMTASTKFIAHVAATTEVTDSVVEDEAVTEDVAGAIIAEDEDEVDHAGVEELVVDDPLRTPKS